MNRSRIIALGATAGALALGYARHRRRGDARVRHALVTGGSRGLGFAIAEELLDRGIAVSICGRDEETLERARAALAPLGQVCAFAADLADAGEIDRLLEEARAAQGPIDMLINNAGIIQVGPVEATDYDDYERTLHVNFLAPARLALSVLPEMRRRGHGHVVNVSSIGGRVAVPHMGPYTASKFALTGFSEGLRAELAGSGVAVTTVCPGLTRTGSARHAEFRGQSRKEHAWFAVSDSLPLLSKNARSTARRIVEAALRGRADVTTTLPARLAVPLHGLFPGLTADALGLANRLLLPATEIDGDGDGDGVRARGRRGRALPSRWAPSLLTRLSDRAGYRLNQRAAMRPRVDGAAGAPQVAPRVSER